MSNNINEKVNEEYINDIKLKRPLLFYDIIFKMVFIIIKIYKGHFK